MDTRGLDIDCRRITFELIKNTLKDWVIRSKNNNISGKHLDMLTQVAKKMETKIFQKATSKDDYQKKIKQKLMEVISQDFNACVASSCVSGSSVGSTMISRPNVVQQNFDGSFLEKNHNTYSRLYEPPQQPLPTSSTIVQQRSTLGQTSLNQSQQFPQFRHHDLVQRGSANPLIQRSRIANQTCGSSNGMSMQFQHGGNAYTQQVPHQSSSQLYHQLGNSRLQGSQISGAFVDSRKLAGESKLIAQSQMTSTGGISAGSSFSNAESTDWKLLIDQYKRARSLYLPELTKRLKVAEEEFLKAQNKEQSQKIRDYSAFLKNSIKILNIQENDLIRISKAKLIQNLNIISQQLHSQRKSTLSVGSVAHRLSTSHGQACVNEQQKFPSVNPTTINKLAISPLSTQQGFPNSQLTAANSLLPGSVNANQQTDKLTLLQSVPHRTADQNTLINDRGNRQLVQPSSLNQSPEIRKSVELSKKEKDLMDSTLPPASNATSRISQKQCSGIKRKSSAISHESWLSLAGRRPRGRPMSSKPHKTSPVLTELRKDTSSLLNAGAISEPKTFFVTVDSPTTPVTQSFAAKDNGIPVVIESSARNTGDSQTSCGADEIQGQTEVQDKSLAVRTPESSVSLVVSDCINPQSDQHSHSEKRPIDRLLEAVQSISQEALSNAVHDMFSVINDMDKLPELAYCDDFESTMEDDLAIVLQETHYGADDEHRPCKKIKHDFEAATMFSKTRWWSEKEPNLELLDEIRETNQRLGGTQIKVVSDSDHERDGTTVRCTYQPVAVSSELRKKFECEIASSTLSIDFLVPSDYPTSPVSLDGVSGGRIETTDLWKKTKSIFDSSVRCIDPLRVGEMAQAWNESAQSVFLQFANLLGAESFSNIHGSWERVLVD